MINPITQLTPTNGLTGLNSVAPTTTQQTSGPSFSDYLRSAVEQVSSDQAAANQASLQLVTGQAPDLSTVMVTTEKAQLSFDLAVQVRNKALDAYQQIMSMQM